MKIGIIGGYSLFKILEDYSEIKYKNSIYFKGKIGNKTVYIIPRHGKNHEIPPHKVPVKEYFELLNKERIKDLITVYSVGVINESWKIPCVVIIDDFIDFTGEVITIYDKFEEKPVHVEMEEPYYKPYQKLMKNVLNKFSIPFYYGVYAQTVGPRLETKAEIKALKILGADAVGMTHSREIILAKEFNMRVLSLGMGVNYACGIKNTRINADKIIEESKKFSEKLCRVIKEFILSME